MSAIGDSGFGPGDRCGYDPELLRLAWAELEQEWDTLRTMCQIAVRRGQEHWHEAMSEVAVRLPQQLLTWDPAGGRTLKSHVVGNCRWYLFKEFVYKRRQREARESAEAERRAASGALSVEPDLGADRDDEEVVRFILGKVHPYHRAVLQLHYFSGLTYEEIGDRLGCSKSTAGIRVRDALGAAAEVAREMR